MHPQLGLRFAAALLFFLLEKTTHSRKNVIFDDFQMKFDQHVFNLLLNRGTTIKTSILTVVEFWWVPQIPEMVVPESSHDRSCSKESPKNVTSTISTPESAIPSTKHMGPRSQQTCWECLRVLQTKLDVEQCTSMYAQALLRPDFEKKLSSTQRNFKTGTRKHTQSTQMHN